MRKFLLLFVFILSTFSLLAQERHGQYKIHKFVDGETFWVKMDGGKTEKIRLIEVGTSEVRWEGLTEDFFKIQIVNLVQYVQFSYFYSVMKRA
jgi:hypothetical protein